MATIKKNFTSDCGEKIKLYTAASLLNIDSQNSEAISLLVFLLNTTQDLEIKKSIIVYLGMLSSNSLEAIDALNMLILYPSQDIRFLVLSSEMLRHIGFENLDAISALTKVLRNQKNAELKYHLAECLGEINPGNLDAIEVFIALLNSENDEGQKIYAINQLSRIGGGSSIVISKFNDLLVENRQSKKVILEVVWCLWLHSSISYEKAHHVIREHIFLEDNIQDLQLAVLKFKAILQDQSLPDIVKQLSNKLRNFTDQEKMAAKKIYLDLALFCMQKMFYVDFYIAWNNKNQF